MNSDSPIALGRDIEASIVPSGDKVTLQKGETARITQTLGGTFTVIVNDIPSSSIHNAGQIAFGLDGKLYVNTGDRGTSSYGQNMTTLAGKMLRVNDDGSIPADNPFVKVPNALSLIHI